MRLSPGSGVHMSFETPDVLADTISDFVDKLEQLFTDELELMEQASINDWIDRLKANAQAVHGFARSGASNLEYEAWIELAAICAARATLIQDLR